MHGVSGVQNWLSDPKWGAVWSLDGLIGKHVPSSSPYLATKKIIASKSQLNWTEVDLHHARYAHDAHISV